MFSVYKIPNLVQIQQNLRNLLENYNKALNDARHFINMSRGYCKTYAEKIFTGMTTIMDIETRLHVIMSDDGQTDEPVEEPDNGKTKEPDNGQTNESNNKPENK